MKSEGQGLRFEESPLPPFRGESGEGGRYGRGRYKISDLITSVDMS